KTQGTVASDKPDGAPAVAGFNPECLCLNLTHSQGPSVAEHHPSDGQHEYFQQQQQLHHLLHVREFRDPWADYYENLERRQESPEPEHEGHHSSHVQDNEHANDEWTAPDACPQPPSPPTTPPPPTATATNENANANGRATAEELTSKDVNSNELNAHPIPPEHATSSPTATATAKAKATPSPHHSVHSQRVRKSTIKAQPEVAAGVQPE
ncbi:Hypothetical predicted protein, partial [Drosophila guanche]